MSSEEAITVTDQTTPAPPQGIRPGPLPTNFEVGALTNDAGDVKVVLSIQTPAGTTFSFIEPANAVRLGNALRAEGKAALSQPPPSGLSLPPGLLVPGNGAVRR